MLKQITFFRKRPDLDEQAFLEHWRTRHADVVCELPGLRRYVQNAATMPGAALDGIAEVWFDDIEAMRANAGHPALDRIRDDERNFIDIDSMASIIAEPETVIDGPDDSAKLLVLVKRQAAVVPEAFHRGWRDAVGGAMLSLAGDPKAPTRYEQDHCRAGGYRGGREPAYDGTASLWFKDPEAAGAFFASAGFAKLAAIERDLMAAGRTQAMWVTPTVIRA